MMNRSVAQLTAINMARSTPTLHTVYIQLDCLPFHAHYCGTTILYNNRTNGRKSKKQTGTKDERIKKSRTKGLKPV